MIPIQHLSCSDEGVYVSFQDIQAGRSLQTWTCPNPDCRYVNYAGIDYCGLCGTPRYKY